MYILTYVFVFWCERVFELVQMLMANPWMSMKERKLGGAAFTFVTKSPYVIIHNVTRRGGLLVSDEGYCMQKKEIVSTTYVRSWK